MFQLSAPTRLYRSAAILAVFALVLALMSAFTISVSAQRAEAGTFQCSYTAAGDAFECTDSGGSNWNSSGSTDSGNVTVPGQTVTIKAGTIGWDYEPCLAWGYSQTVGNDKAAYPIGAGVTCYGGFIICAPEGNKSATGALVKYVWEPVNAKKPNGPLKKVYISSNKTYTYECAYPSKEFTYTASATGSGNCVISLQLSLYQSTSKSTIQTTPNGGTFYGNTPVETTQPKFTYSNVEGTCKDQSTVKISWTKALPKDPQTGLSLTGYYRIQAKEVIVNCVKYLPDAGAKGAKPVYDCSGTTPAVYNPAKIGASQVKQSSSYQYAYFTNACNIKGVKDGFADGAIFDANSCATDLATAVCKVQPIKINNSTSPQQLLRNGSNVSVLFQTPTITGSGIRDQKDMEQYADVVSGSSPYYGSYPSDLNSSNQYFKLRTLLGSNENFRQWILQSTAKNSNLVFFWASDPSSTWQMSAQYQETAELQVYNNNTDSSDLGWTKPVTYSCNGDSYSAKESIVRSVNSN